MIPISKSYRNVETSITEPGEGKTQAGFEALATSAWPAHCAMATALMSTQGAASERDIHLQKALAGAKTDAILARNLASRFPKSGA